ncbi:MAG: hypothetical protein FWE21_06515 [Defluviitaleaceae bacterium]|nr:hypothetical protein [Defluviitaleaceae bacterium]
MKLSNTVIEKLLNPAFKSRNAIALLFYIARLQDDSGFVVGLHYKDIQEALKINPSGFYAAMKYLEEHDIIETNWNGNNEAYDYGYFALHIKDNDFSKRKSFKQGYLNIHRAIFANPIFMSAPCNIQKLVIKFTQHVFINFKHMKDVARVTYATVCKWLGVKMRTAKRLVWLMEFLGILKLEKRPDGFSAINFGEQAKSMREEDNLSTSAKHIRNTAVIAHALRIAKARKVEVEDLQFASNILVKHGVSCAIKIKSAVLDCAVSKGGFFMVKEFGTVLKGVV